MSVCFVYMRRGANSRLGMDHTRGDRGPSVHMEISNGAAAQGKKEGIGAQRVTLLCRPRKVPHPNRAENAKKKQIRVFYFCFVFFVKFECACARYCCTINYRNASDTVQEKATAREGPATPKNKRATAREGPATAAEKRGDTQNQTGDTPKKQATAVKKRCERS